jgi:hypothetical protein
MTKGNNLPRCAERCDRFQAVTCKDQAYRQRTKRSNSCVSDLDYGRLSLPGSYPYMNR